MLVPTNEESATHYYMLLERMRAHFQFVYEPNYARNKAIVRKREDADAREAAAVLAAARQAAHSERVAAENRKRKIDEVSDQVVKKLKDVLKDELKNALESPEILGRLADAFLAWIPSLALRAAAGESQQNAREGNERDAAEASKWRQNQRRSRSGR